MTDDPDLEDVDDVDDAPDPEEQEQQRDDPPDRSLLFRAVIWIRTHLPTLLGGGIIGGVLVTAVLGVEVPRWLRLGGLVYGLVLLLIGRPTSSKVKELLWQPRMIVAVDCAAEDDDGGVYEVPMQHFQEWSIEGRGDWRSPNLVFFESVDFENQRAVGTWTGTLSGRQLLLGLHEVKRLREVEEDAKRGRALEANLWTIVRRATHGAVRRINETFAKGTLPGEGDDIDREIDKVLAKFGAKGAEIEDRDDDAPANEVPGIELQVPDVDDLATAGRETGGVDD